MTAKLWLFLLLFSSHLLLDWRLSKRTFHQISNVAQPPKVKVGPKVVDDY